MSSRRRGASSLLFVASVCILLPTTQTASAQSIPLTFTIDPAQSVMTGVGTVTGDFLGTGNVSTLSLTPQSIPFKSGNGGVTSWAGTIDSQVGYDPGSKSPIRLMLTSANITPQNSGNEWQPGQLNPDGTWVPGSTAPAQYAYNVSTLVNSAVRNTVLTALSGNNTVSGTSIPGNFGLQFTAGFLDIYAPLLDSNQRQNITDQIVAWETDPMTGDIVWRNKIGEHQVNGHTVIDYDMTSTQPPFSGGNAQPVHLYGADGLPLPQLFQNDPAHASGTSSLVSTPLGGNSYGLDLTLATHAVARFFLGDFEVDFTFDGKIVSHATASLPALGDANDDGKATGLDYAIWAQNYNLFNASANATYKQGDWTGDGKVTGTDYALWAQNYAPSKTAAPSLGTYAVPEPSTFLLGLCGALGITTILLRSRARFG
jgi:hypothetical protein